MWLHDEVKATEYSHLNIPGGDLRFSITSECSYLCSYCHKEGGQSNNELPTKDILSIVRRSMEFGVRSVRLTGGEPMLHKNIVDICREIKQEFPNIRLGINTNGAEIDKLIYLISCGYINSVAVGIDYFDGVISKNSSVGLSSKKILGNVIKIKKNVDNVSLSTVFDGDMDNIEKLVEWCFQHKIFIKILEVVNEETAERPDFEYEKMVRYIIDKYSLSIYYNMTKKQYLATSSDGNSIYFFHSHCRLRECATCARLHLRVDCTGKSKACLFSNTPEFSLLDNENYRENFRAAIHYLGTPPEKYIKL